MSGRIIDLDGVEEGDTIQCGSRTATVQEIVEGGGLGGPRPHMVVQFQYGDEETREIKESDFGAMHIRHEEGR